MTFSEEHIIALAAIYTGGAAGPINDCGTANDGARVYHFLCDGGYTGKSAEVGVAAYPNGQYRLTLSIDGGETRQYDGTLDNFLAWRGSSSYRKMMGVSIEQQLGVCGRMHRMATRMLTGELAPKRNWLGRWRARRKEVEVLADATRMCEDSLHVVRRAFNHLYAREFQLGMKVSRDELKADLVDILTNKSPRYDNVYSVSAMCNFGFMLDTIRGEEAEEAAAQAASSGAAAPAEPG